MVLKICSWMTICVCAFVFNWISSHDKLKEMFFFFLFLKGHGGRLKDESDVLLFLFRILHCDLAYALWRFLFLFLMCLCLFFFFFLERGCGGVFNG